MQSLQQLAKNLRRVRRSADLTQQQVANALSITKAAVSEWENARNAPTRERLSALADLYKVKLSDLLEGIGPAESPSRVVLRELAHVRPGLARPLPGVANSQRVRVWQQEFQLELTKAGASDDEIAEAMDLVRAPQVFSFYAGGAPKEFTEDDAIKGMVAIALFIRSELRKRGRKFPK